MTDNPKLTMEEYRALVAALPKTDAIEDVQREGIDPTLAVNAALIEGGS